jgi:16S rRNA (adenine1518-N6/adenine1519-N6)-dimethyltransferase
LPEYTGNKIYPKKSLGQNYLKDDNICRNIVSSFDPKPGENVIEIGPGQGAITKYLVESGCNLTTVEFDKNNTAILRKEFPGLNVINGDFLKFDLDTVGKSSGLLRIIGNIPYNITSPIIFKLIDSRAVIMDSQLMIQEEVAQRICATPGNKEYGIPSVITQAFSEPKLLFKVSKNSFYPKPKVDSRLVYFDFRKSMESKIKDVVFFRRLVKAAFSTRRKTLKNSLKNMEVDISKTGIDPGRRAETLSVREFIDMSNILC